MKNLFVKKTAILFIVLFVFISDVTLSQVSSYVFTATVGTYTSITGVSPDLTGDGADPLRDEGFANNIQLGFTFNYLGTNYTTICASTNGFAAFGTITTPGFSNSMASGGTGRSLLAPLWEDIALAGAADLQYTTTGAPGSRVFILQWSNTFFDFGATDTALSFQVRLYETTNKIEFIYKQLPGPVQDFSGGASIGITGATTGSGSFLSLNNSSASPVASSTVAVNTITTRPATGQVYTFTPPACIAPGSLSVTNITTTSASFSWANAPGGTSYEYSISLSPLPPVSGTPGSAGILSVSGLMPGTQYYLHARTNCGGTFSGWNTISFVTVCDAADLPYTMPISGVVAPALPGCTTVQDVNLDGNTWRTYPSGGPGWTDQVIAYVFNINGTTAANDWLFTKGLNLSAGTYYRLRFKYNNDFTSLYAEKLKVAYGNANTAVAMTNILADYPSVFAATPKTVTIDFTPASSGIYYIGFQAYSEANKDVLILDDISVDLRPSCDAPVTLAAGVIAAGATVSANISWAAPAVGSPTGYEYAVITSAAPPASGTVVVTTSATVSNLVAYTQYYLHVRTNCGGAYSAWATLPFTTVPNDEPCTAIEITVGGAPACANTTLATSVSDARINCSTPNNTVWYKYTPSVNGTIVLHLTTQASPAKPLHGWVAWYNASGVCPGISLVQNGSCSEFGNNGNSDVDELISPVLTAGTTYYIMIDGSSDDVGEFCISIPACSPPLAVTIDNIVGTGARVSWAGSGGTYIVEYGPPGFTPGAGATAGAGGTVINSAAQPQTITGLSLSQTYHVYVRQNCTAANNGYSSNSTLATFTTLGTPPANDDCAGAVNLTVYESACTPVNGTTLNATPSGTLPLPSCGASAEGYDDDVWYKFTPLPGQMFVTIDFVSTGGNNDMVAQVYTTSDNSCNGTFTLYQCSEDNGINSMPGFTSMPVTPGTTYFIRTFSYSRGENGQVTQNSQFTICITKALLVNDNATGAKTIEVNAGCTGAIYSNAGATQSLGEPAGSCSSTIGYSTIWYKFTAPEGGAVRISTATGSGNTLTNTRVALFDATNVNDYTSFSIIACDEDGGSGAFGSMSVLYATGLTVDKVYYIEVDKFDAATAEGSFCLTVDKFNSSMLSTAGNCNSVYQTPVGSIATYNGWVPVMDDSSKLIALVRNTAGAPVSGYTVSQNINNAAVRKDITSGEYYLNRNYTINNTANGSAPINVQFFFLANELTALNAVDPAASLSRLRVTRQSASACQPDFAAANGTNAELPQTGYGTSNGVSWIKADVTGNANYYIHAVKSYLTTKVFLQGAFDAAINRHKDVTTAWAGVLKSFAKRQPYNAAPIEGFGAGTPGGTGKTVFHVTTLSSNGAGSLKSVMGSNRTIVFDVAGTINNFTWEGSGSTSVSFLTIDGSTAPSPGITLKNTNLGDCLSFQYGCHDIIVKNIRVRNASNDGMNVVGGYNIVFDHVSISGSGDGDLDITDGAYNITVQNCIFGQGKPTWSGAMLIAYPGTRDISVHHNLFSCYGTGVGERSPLVHNATNYVPNLITYLMADFTNNVVWKWGNSNGGWGYGSGADYGGTLQARNNFYQSTGLSDNAIIKSHDSNGAQVYASGNVSGNAGINPNAVSNVAVPWPVAAITMQDACTAAAKVLAESGTRPLDSTDLAIINAVSLTTCPDNNTAAVSFATNEMVTGATFTSTADTTDVLDWVLLEIKNSAGVIMAKRAAFVREDGKVVDLDKVSPVSFYNLPTGDYNIFIKHRNHLGIRSSSLQTFSDVALGVGSSITSYDFTTAQSKAYQNPAITTNAAMAQNGNTYMMWAGNANGE